CLGQLGRVRHRFFYMVVNVEINGPVAIYCHWIACPFCSFAHSSMKLPAAIAVLCANELSLLHAMSTTVALMVEATNTVHRPAIRLTQDCDRLRPRGLQYRGLRSEEHTSEPQS